MPGFKAPVTAVYIFFCFLVMFLVHIQKIDQYSVYFDHDKILDGEWWRLFGSLVYFGEFSAGTLVSVIYSSLHLRECEVSSFSGRTADFLIFLCCGMLACWGYGLLTPATFLGQGLKYYCVYYYGKKMPDEMTYVFAVPLPVRTAYVAFIFLGLTALFSSYIFWLKVWGCCVAQLFFFFKDVISLRYDLSLFTASQSVNNFANRLFHQQ
jgi:Derlin-2/3